MKTNKTVLLLWGVLTLLLLYFNIDARLEANRLTALIKEEKSAGKARLNTLMYSICQSPEVLNSYYHNKNKLQDIDSSVLIYRYAQGVCSPCFQEDLTALYKIQDELGKERVLILPAYRGDRNSQLSMKNELHKFNFKNLPQDSLYIPVNIQEGARDRYFAVINSQKELEMVFFPQAGFPELTQLYLNRAGKRLQSKKQE